jgi:probable rRNA maturation factor
VKLLVDIQTATQNAVPPKQDIESWIAATLAGRTAMEHAEVSVRLVDSEEMAVLNETYRGKKGPTNVLSFPADLPANLPLPLLGDIVICAPIVRDEAAQQGKSQNAHWAHMTVHGTLHLLGYDHVEEQEAEHMEALESTILNELKYACPYETNHPSEHSS